MTEQERLLEILKWNPGRFAKKTSKNLSEIAGSKKPWWRKRLKDAIIKYYFEMLALTSNDMEVIAVMQFWVNQPTFPWVDCPVQNHFHTTYGNIIAEMMDQGTYNNFSKKLKNILKEN